jgi:CheY-like chemotaxis protein
VQCARGNKKRRPVVRWSALMCAVETAGVEMPTYRLYLAPSDAGPMNGIEFMDAYTTQPGQDTPVVIFSTHDTQADGRLMPPFVIDRLSKDFAISEFLAFVTQYVKPEP